MSGGLARGLGLRLGGAATHLSLGARGRHLEAGRVHGHKAHAARVDGTVYEERVAWLGVGLGLGLGLSVGLGSGLGLGFGLGLGLGRGLPSSAAREDDSRYARMMPPDPGVTWSGLGLGFGFAFGFGLRLAVP